MKIALFMDVLFGLFTFKRRFVYPSKGSEWGTEAKIDVGFFNGLVCEAPRPYAGASRRRNDVLIVTLEPA